MPLEKKNWLRSTNNNNNRDKARWQRAAEGWYPEELSTAADPFKQNGNNETIRPKLVSSVPVYHAARRRPRRRHPLVSS